MGPPARCPLPHRNHPASLASLRALLAAAYDRTEADERVDVYPIIVAAGVRVLIYNGEADACVPWLDNEQWVESLGYTATVPWTSWQTPDNQVAGYVTTYGAQNFSFATVKGSGHMVRCVHPAASSRAPPARPRPRPRAHYRPPLAPLSARPSLFPPSLPQVPQFTPLAALSLITSLVRNTPL